MAPSPAPACAAIALSSCVRTWTACGPNGLVLSKTMSPGSPSGGRWTRDDERGGRGAGRRQRHPRDDAFDAERPTGGKDGGRVDAHRPDVGPDGERGAGAPHQEEGNARGHAKGRLVGSLDLCAEGEEEIVADGAGHEEQAGRDRCACA